MCKFFYIMVSSFRCLRKYNMNIMKIYKLLIMSRHSVCVKYHNQFASLHRLIITQYIKQPASCTVKIDLCKL